jgi:ankyrin repeat protein
VFAILLVFHLPICFSAETPDPSDPNRYLNAVRTFADNVLKYGRDTYGPKHTPLFVDGLNIYTLEPGKWIVPKPLLRKNDGLSYITTTETEEWILSNFASQQTLLRTLDGLSEITEDLEYRDAAIQAVRYAFENLRSPNGLFYWGGCTAYDALGDAVCGRGDQVLKLDYPYYQLMWKTDAEATEKLVGKMWSAHVLDWSNLDTDRFGLLSEDLENPWNHEYQGGPTFFKSKRSWGIGNVLTGSSLIHAGVTLTKLSGQQQPLVWSKRLAKRFVDTRHPATGISSMTYNGTWMPVGEDMQDHLKDPHTAVFPWDLHANSFRHFYPENAQPHPWIAFFLAGEMVEENSRDFTQWALEELTAWGKASYRREDNSFVPMLTDGTSLERYVWKNGHGQSSGYNIVNLCPADMPFFWAYSLAYRRTGDGFMWQMLKDIVAGNGLGNIGRTPTYRPKLQLNTACDHPYGVFGFLELYKSTKQPAFNIVEKRFHNGFFVSTKKHSYTRFDCFEPLALLRLVAAMRSKSEAVPQPWPGLPLFVDKYRYKIQGIDRHVIYALTELSEPPISLQEAAAIGDVDLARSLIENGAKVQDFGNTSYTTALHRAAIEGHKPVVELLLAKGAPVNERDLPLKTPLYYAVLNGHKNIVELLLTHGADVNSKDGSGQTPLHWAVEKGHREIVELLIDKGADVGAKNNDGRSPIDVVRRRDRSGIRELLQAKAAETSIHGAARQGLLMKVRAFLEDGVNVNDKDDQGLTPLHLAAQEGHREVVEHLLSKNADINVKNEMGLTPLHVAVIGDDEELVRLLTSSGADANARMSNRLARTPLHIAAVRGYKKLVVLLVADGADVSIEDGQGRTPLDLAKLGGRTEIVEILTKAAEEQEKEPSIALRRNLQEVADLLLEKGAETSIHLAAQAGDLERIKDFVQTGIDVNEKDDSGMTPLLYAVSGKQTKVAEFLIEKGADVNAGDRRGCVPLLYALWNNDSNAVKMLLNKGADVNAKDAAMGYPPLHWAVLMDNNELVKVILGAGGDVNAKSNTGDTPLDVAAYGASPAVGELLVAKGAEVSSLHAAACIGDLVKVKAFINDGVDVDAKSNMVEVTALHSAAIAGHKEIADFLISQGSDVNAQNGPGQTPLHFAAKEGHLDVLNLLLENGADVHLKDRRGRTPVDFALREKHKQIVVLLQEQMQVRDVSVTKISATPSCTQGETVSIVVTLDNQGNTNEFRTVRLTDTSGSIEIAHQSVTTHSKYWEASDANLIITGEVEDETEFGIWCNADGDVNGDGFKDLLITANHYPAMSISKGRAYLYYGGPNMDSAADKRFTGEEHGDVFGGNSGLLVDMNNDNFDDVVIGARNHDDKGRVYIFNGGADMDEEPDIIVDPPASDGTGLRFGRGGMHAGDFNGDGMMDLVCSAIGYGPYIGRVYLYYGPLASDITVDKAFTGEIPGGTFGPIIGVGDINGDNCDDLLVATRYFPAVNPPAFGNVGRAYLYYGASGTSMDTICDVMFDPPDGGKNEFGSSADVFDIDNDGFADVIIGARRYPNGRSIGRAYVYWGNPNGFDNTVGLTITGETAHSAFGGDFINCGYADDNQYGDILITAYGYNREQSRAYLYSGGTQREIDAVADHIFTPEPGRNGVFRSVLADLNGDGHGDVIMSGCYYNNSQGRAWLWYGPFSTTTNITFDWDTTNASIGKHTLRTEIPPVQGEQNTEDNVKTVTIEVKEPPK